MHVFKIVYRLVPSPRDELLTIVIPSSRGMPFGIIDPAEWCQPGGWAYANRIMRLENVRPEPRL
jgi:hypothetical protein